VSKLGKLREAAGYEQKDIAQRYGVDPSYLSRIETGKIGMTGEWAQRFAGDYGVSLERVFSCFNDSALPGNYIPPPPPPAKPDIQPVPDEFISIPVYNVLASAGGGAWLDDRTCIIDSLTFRRDWLRKKTSARSQDMAVIKVHGDSMEPMLKGGDCVLVDMTQKALAGGGVFVIEQDGALLVKRLLPLPGNKVLVISENDRYPDYEMQDGASIVGRAIHKMGDI